MVTFSPKKIHEIYLSDMHTVLQQHLKMAFLLACSQWSAVYVAPLFLGPFWITWYSNKRVTKIRTVQYSYLVPF